MRRNDLAHEPGKSVDWQEFHHVADVVEQELQHLGLVGEATPYKFFAERSGIRDSESPDVAFERDYAFGLKSGDEWVIRYGWVEQVYRVKGE